MWRTCEENREVNTSTTQGIQAFILVNEPARALSVVEILAQRGISATVGTDPEEVLGLCGTRSPHLVVVENSLGTMSGARFLAELLRVSWTTASILIWDEDEETVHEKTEGLGILGSIRSVQDTEALEKLIDKFFILCVPGQ
jgi:DNA-binding NarL/FixJ family response regulator